MDSEIPFKIGPTGKFPQGKLWDNDAGELAIAIIPIPGHVLMHFGADVDRIGMTVEGAEALAKTLLECASAARNMKPDENVRRN
jgi:hypothetical protein